MQQLRWANRTVKNLRQNGRKNSRKYATVLRAFIESALATWIGILLFEIASLAPEGHVTVGSIVLVHGKPMTLKGKPSRQIKMLGVFYLQSCPYSS